MAWHQPGGSSLLLKPHHAIRVRHLSREWVVPAACCITLMQCLHLALGSPRLHVKANALNVQQVTRGFTITNAIAMGSSCCNRRANLS